MKEFRAFPTTCAEEDGEIIIDYRPGNGNQPLYPRYDKNHICINCIGEEYEESM